jgi:two-component system sensor kinase FixL
MTIYSPARRDPKDWLYLAAFVALYVLLDWLSYIEPLFRLNITPWNPDPALGLVIWLRYGRRAALPWFAALVLAELLVRGLPAGLPLTLLLSAQLTLGYGLIGEALRRVFANTRLLDNRRRLFSWLGIVLSGLSLNGVIYIGLLWLAGFVPAGSLVVAAVRFVIGDIVGVVVSMPLIWMLASHEGRRTLATVLRSPETAGYLLLSAFLVWGVFHSVIGSNEFKHFYFLFIPIIWAATRHGLPGTGLVAFVLQFSIILIVRIGMVGDIPFAELQLLGAALALVGFFIGVVVDEQRQTAEGLKQSLRLAAAGEMAAALAHELNQPMTALVAYGRACEHLLARGETGALLSDTIGKMVRESVRASEVVRRLREFFRTGAMHLETTSVAAIVTTVTRQFEAQCAAHGIALAVVMQPGLVVHADRLQIELVVRNLIANALDAVLTRTETGGRITVSTSGLKGGRLQVSVHDNGPGVSNAVAARLFEPFVSGKSSGLGLGLVLSRAIVEAHGGRLWAEVGDKGIFNFILPLLHSGGTGNE